MLVKCIHCRQYLTGPEYLIGYCPTSPHTFHDTEDRGEEKPIKPDAHLGGVGGE